MEVPPGLAYLARRIPRILITPSLIYLLNTLLLRSFRISLPTWLLVLASVFSVPAAIAVSARYADWRDRREAAKLGAVLPPTVPDAYPLGLKNLKIFLNNFRDGYPGEPMDRWREIYGNTHNVRILAENRYFTAEPEYIKAILATQFDSFEKGPKTKFNLNSLLGDGVFNSDGDLWKFHRSMTRPFFSKDRISHFDIFERHAEDAIVQLKARIKDGYPVDMQDVFSRFTLDSATEFLFGNDVCSLSAGLPYPAASAAYPSPPAIGEDKANDFAQAFSKAQTVGALRSRFGPQWPLKEFWRDECKVHMRVVDAYIMPILAEAVAKKKQEGSAAKEVKDDETLLDHLVNYTEDQKILKDEIMNIMIAGRDTTATTLTFAVYMLAEHPDILARLRSEILTAIGSARRPTYEDLRDMKYLRAFINETLRLYPAVPFNARTTTKPVILPPKAPGESPFYVPAHTKVAYSVMLMHRRKDLWGPDAHEFDPDRFLDERLHKYLTPNPFIFLPFNAGPRICLGQQFAYNETSFMLVRLLQNFSAMSLVMDALPVASRPPASWSAGNAVQAREKVWPRTHLTMYAFGGVWMTMEEAGVGETV